MRFLKLAPNISKGMDLYTSDEHLPYMTRPLINKHVDLKTGEFTFFSKHNSAGLRDVEHSFNKDTGVFRILGLGDSSTYGFGANFKDTYLYILEWMLNDRKGPHPKIEIIKAGIPASYAEIQRIYLEYYGVKYSPDLILAGFLAHDVIDAYHGLNYFNVTSDNYLTCFRQNTVFLKFCKFLYFHSHLFRAILLRLYDKFIFFNSHDYWLDIYKKDGFHEDNWKKVENEYSKMADITSGIGAKLVIVYIPEKTVLNKGIDMSYPAVRLSNWSKANNAYFIDILPAFQKGNDMSRFYWQEGHCNPAGYKLIAETIYTKLTEQKLVP